MASIGAIVFQGAILGLVATLAMDVVVRRLDEGMTAPYVAASVLTGVSPDDVTERRAKVVHYAAGAASGVLFLALLELTWGLFGAGGRGLGLGGLVAVVVTSALLFGWLVGFFTLVVLPRYDRGMARQRLRRVRRHWTAAAATHVLAIVALWFLLTQLV